MEGTSERELHVSMKQTHWTRSGIFLSVILGLAALLYYFSWWFQDGRLRSPAYILWFAAAAVFSLFQVLFIWRIDLATFDHPTRSDAPAVVPTVDVFVTACGEPYAIIERTVTAACGMRGNHRTSASFR
jgi:hypothetical protein